MKIVNYQCDCCSMDVSCAPGEYPKNWRTITLTLRAHASTTIVDEHRRVLSESRGDDKPQATAYIHLCDKCTSPKDADVVFEKLVDASAARRVQHRR